jgi:hypothetical protein
MPYLTLRGGKNGEAVGSVQVTVDGKDYLARLDREIEVPQKVAKALQDTGHKFDTGKNAGEEG